MCLILFACHTHPDYALVVAANRDEFHERPSRDAHFWPEAPNLLAGRDSRAGGTWLGLTRQGRFAALTNYRQLDPDTYHNSRGELAVDYLCSQKSAPEWLQGLQPRAQDYSGFNLLVGGPEGLYYFSNRNQADDQTPPLSPGVYGLSNHLLDSPWPKVQRGKLALTQRLSRHREEKDLVETLLGMLQDETPVVDTQLPDTGVGLDKERLLATTFIRSPSYGTRCSTVLLVAHTGQVHFCEQRFDHHGRTRGVSHFSFTLD